MTADDPTRIRSIAVTAEDVVSAYEAAVREQRSVVLRITPPFNGRMRARLHVPQDTDMETGAVHVDPQALVDESRVDPYPSPDDTEDELRADPDRTYTRDRHYEVHAEAVDAWREGVRDAIVDEVVVETDAGPHAIAVKRLG